ncbi:MULTISPECIES: aldolase/citrate lyase family protein [unclassified Chelatococcus]|uniref:HpcH/HpaI aldolase family protein n=1 Tax=unclassified Chelatococcus TaxID=2638111 RepID=UPI001BCFE56A|nr:MULTISPECIES: aldolase/citrate lyase family protein [unclassified Chelatococcus]MBS7700627.1 hypothetical protein [Chelatococcus sp. YT9]MBX3559058.1 hypothetical protein [Chelatococcus sp.]
MKQNLKEKLRNGEPVFGTFAFMASPDIVEIMGYAGFDFVIIDLEHSPKNWSDVANMIRAAELRDMAALVRVRENADKSILEVLELGAAGIVIPFVQSEDDVRKAVKAINYAPKGERGTCTLTRAAHYGGLRSEFLAHCIRQNEELVIVGQIEDRAGVDQIDAIVGCNPGLDALIVGRADLASSLGTPGQVEAPGVLEATGRIVEAARRGGVAAGIGIYSPPEASRWIDAGCSLFFYSADTTLLLNAATSANKDFRETVARRG